MPITNNIHWDERLEAFKGSETTHYVLAAAATADHCADCTVAFGPDDILSLVIDIQQGEDFWLTGSRHFDTYVCHRTCQSPDLTLREVTGPGDRTDPQTSQEQRLRRAAGVEAPGRGRRRLSLRRGRRRKPS